MKPTINCFVIILMFVTCTVLTAWGGPDKKVKSDKRLETTLKEIKQNMVNVEGSCFMMGDTSGDEKEVETPVHEVCVSNFAISKYEVTQGQWRKIMGNNPSYNKKCGDNCPVEKVSWKDSQKFINTLNRLTGNGFRLPTEAEWEFACRSGKSSEKYCGSENVDAVAWYSDNSEFKTHPVGEKQPNALGIYDMSGNVWEWVNDWYGDYPSDVHKNPQGPSSASHRVDRGGSYRSTERFVQSARRASNTPDDRVTDLGLRLASSVE